MAAASASVSPSISRMLLPSRKAKLQASGPDPSVVRPAVAVAYTGMKQAVKVLETGTPEIKSYLLDEVNVIYECKTCLNMFRSLVNLISHKRSYCKTKFCEVRHVFRRDPEDVPSNATSTTTAFVEAETVDTIVPEKEWDVSDYSPSLQLMREAGIISELEIRPPASKYLKGMNGRKPGLGDIVRKLQIAQDAVPEEAFAHKMSDCVVYTEKIKQTDRAVFQTYMDDSDVDCSSMGQQYVELERLKQRPSVFVGPDGKVLPPDSLPARPASVPFSTWADIKEEEQPKIYACDICKKAFKKPIAVYKHAINMHSKTAQEAKVLKAKAVKNANVQSQSIQSSSNIPPNLYSTKQCRICSKSFPTSFARRNHELFSCQRGPTMPVVRLTRCPLPVPAARPAHNDQDHDSGISNQDSDDDDCEVILSKKASPELMAQLQASFGSPPRRRKALAPKKILFGAVPLAREPAVLPTVKIEKLDLGSQSQSDRINWRKLRDDEEGDVFPTTRHRRGSARVSVPASTPHVLRISDKRRLCNRDAEVKEEPHSPLMPTHTDRRRGFKLSSESHKQDVKK